MDKKAPKSWLAMAFAVFAAVTNAACEEIRPPGGENLPPLPGGTLYNDWTWVETAGSVCRDGSPAGYYYRLGTKKELVVYLNGGGACADPFFCGLNPVNVNQDLPIARLLDGTLNLVLGPDARRQLAPDEGIFKRDARNPVADWSMIYVPYCTGDIHAGSRRNVTVPGVDGPQQFAGYTNYGLFLNSFGPSFANAGTVLLTGSSAGGFGTLINFDRTQEFFAKSGVKVLAVSDSGVPFRDQYMATCLQKRWRTYWGLNDAIPADCGPACFDASGGKIVEGLGNYLFKQKYKDRNLGGFVSSAEDQIIRAFYAPGLNATAGGPDNCTLDPGLNTVASALYVGSYSGPKYHDGLRDVVNNVIGAERVSTYVMPGDAHMHLWRSDFYNTNGTNQTIADWLADILAERVTHVGDL